MQPISSDYRSTPPSSAVQINRGNPIARGLQRAWFASTGIDHVSGIPAVNSAATHNVPGQNQFGATLRCSGAQSMESYTVPHITAMDGGKEFTVFTVSTTNSGAERPLAGVWGKTGYRQFYLAITDFFRSPYISVADGGTTRVYSASVATVPTGVRVAVAGGWRASDDDCRLWLNGSPVTGTKGGDTVSAMPTVSNPVSIAAQGTGGFAALSGDIELVLIFNRLLSDAEIRSLAANPYQVLKAPRRALWLDVVAGGVVTGTLSATDVADAASVSGSASAPSASGALSASDAQDIASFTGALIFSGSLSATDSPDSATLAGTAYAPGVSGTLAAADSADSAVFAGALSFVGALAATEVQDAAALSGTAFAPGFSGTLAATDSADSAAFAGVLSFVGSLAAVEAQDSVAVAGAFGPSGSIAATDQKDSATFAGSYTGGVAGALAAADQPDSALFAGAVDNGGLAIVVSHQRVLIVPRQSRALAVAAESRTLTIAP